MSHKQDIDLIVQKYKRFLERSDIFPYKYVEQNQTYQCIHFYRISSKIYGSFAFLPLETGFEKIKIVFYNFILMDKYLQNTIKNLNNFANKDYSEGLGNYKVLLLSVLETHSEIKAIQKDIGKAVEHIGNFEISLQRIKEKYNTYELLVNEIKTKQQFSMEDLEKMRSIYGEASAWMFNQYNEQLNVSLTSQRIKDFLGQGTLISDKKILELYNKAKIIIEPSYQAKLEHALNHHGDPKLLRKLSFEELSINQAEKYEKHVYEIYDLDFIKRRVRNPSVQEN